MKKPSLVVLAAGLGSRYGSLKQMDQFGPSGETIVDYAIYDAIKVGFGKIVFVIRKHFETEFKEIFVPKTTGKIAVEFVCQELDELPEGFSLPDQREKPWGTAHAVLMAKSKVNEPFAIINADDFYGRTSFKKIHDHLQSLDNSKMQACMVGFVLKNTLSDHGRVSRGMCKVDENNLLQEIIERTHIYKTDTEGTYFEEDGQKTPLTGKEIVSMNLMGFTSGVFNLIEEQFIAFLKKSQNELKSEFYIPSILENIRQSGNSIPVLKSEEQWFGVTYSEDKIVVQESLSKLIEDGVYPSNLWADN